MGVPGRLVHAMAVNLAANAILVPKHGGTGAAIALVLSGSVQLLIFGTLSQHYFPISYEKRQILKLVIAAAVAFVLGSLVDEPLRAQHRDRARDHPRRALRAARGRVLFTGRGRRRSAGSRTDRRNAQGLASGVRMTISKAEVERRLIVQYEGVFTPGEVDSYFDEYVALEPTRPLADRVAESCGQGAAILDVGCGYGAFVTVARKRGLDARGLDTAEFEIAYARQRVDADDPDDVFVLGDGQGLPFDDATFDGLTLWNVIEHVPDTPRLLAEAERVLRPGGRLFAIAPNYAAFRREAHYHVPWLPKLPAASRVAT